MNRTYILKTLMMVMLMFTASVQTMFADNFTAFPGSTTLTNAEAFDHTKVKFFEGEGTAENPYQIADAQQLRLLAFLCRQYDNATVQFNGKQAFDYASAHYVLTADIDLGGVTDWRPIGELRFVLNETPAANNECRSTQSNVFQGVFDGKGHTIRNLTMRWGTTDEYAVQNSIHGSMKQYGLFGFVGKGKSTKQADTEIKNIIIDNFRFFNDGKQGDGTTDIATTNSNRSTVGTLSGNNSFSYIIGPLAAVVTHGTRITNVDVKKADATLTAAIYHMTDKNDRRIYVGGAIGTVMNNAITSPEANTATNVKITNVATVIDVDMKNLTANKMTDVNFRSGLCIGGIVGRIHAASNKDVNNTINIKGTMFSGKIEAPLFMTGPVWGSANVLNDYNGANIPNMAYQYEGKRIKNTETYLEPQYAYFHDYFISNNARSLIEVKRDNLMPQNDGRSYVMQARGSILSAVTQNDFTKGYQGINGGEEYNVSGSVDDLNQGELFNAFNATLAIDGGYKWQWGNVGLTKEFHLATGNPASAITIEQVANGSNVTLTAVTNNTALTEFTWTIGGVEQGEKTKSITIPATAADRTMKVVSGTVSSAEMTLKGSVPLTFTITDNDATSKRYAGFEKHTHTITPSDGGTYYYKWAVYDENGMPIYSNCTDERVIKDPEHSNTFAIRPHWLNNTYVVGVYADREGNQFVAMKTGTVPRAYLRVENPSAEKNTFGTSTNNYLIGYSNDQATAAGIDADEAEANGARELFLISYLTNMREANLGSDARYDIEIQPNKENNVVHSTGAYYSSRYYKMMGDADFSKAAELVGKSFTPISSMSQQNPNTYSERAFMFRGTFEGNFHAVKNLYMLWRGDKVGANDYVSKWGVFGYIGGINFNVDGITGAKSYLTKQSAVVRNLIIDGAVIKHDADETMFSYNKTAPATNTVSHAAIGVLAGIVGSYATVQNIEIRNSNINDEGSSDYDLWTRGLHIGGVIGSLQYGPQSGNVQLEANGTNRNSVQYKLVENKVENLSAHVNITIEHAKVHDTQQVAQLPLLNVGGILGRYCVTSATQDEAQAGLPKYTFFTGDIKAPNCWVSPIIASTRYTSQNGLSADKYSKQWEGNNAVAGTQLTISDALFYNYRIHDGRDYQLITDNYPYNECAWGARSMASHIDAVDNTGSYSAKEYQGVNYNATYISGSEVATMFNDDAMGGIRMALAILNSHKTNANGLTYWAWDDEDAAPHMVTDDSRPFYSYIKKNENIEKPNTYNVVSSDGSTNKYYVWKINGTAQDSHTSELDIPVISTTQKVVVDVYENEAASSTESNRLAQTQYIIKLGKFTCASTITKDKTTYTVSLKDENGRDISTSDYEITYQWYTGDVVDGEGATAIKNATLSTRNINESETAKCKYVLCHVTIKHKESNEMVFDEYVSYYVNNNNTSKVVYLYLKADSNNKVEESLTASNGKTYPRWTTNNNDTNRGESPENPCLSWNDAYKQLAKYTEPTQADVQNHGGTWTSVTDYDDEAYYLLHKEDYPFDTYKRKGSQRKVKPIDKCSVTWDNNIIVVMGKAVSNYFADATRMKRDDADASNQSTGNYADRPVTITGKWNGIDYYGTVINTADHFTVNADHKFENIGFGIKTTGRFRIYAHRWNIWAGKGILMGWEAAKHAGITGTANSEEYRLNNADASTGTPIGNYTADIAVMGGYCDDTSNSNPEGWEYINHGRDEVGQQILLQSGSWGPVCPGNRQTTSTGIDTYFVMGGPDHPAKTTITVDLDRAWNDAHTEFKKGLRATVDVACILTGNHEGTMYGDVTLNIKSGKMGRIVNGIKGAQRLINNNDKFTTNSHYRHVMKVNNEWVEVNAPAPDSYFGRGVINIIPNGGDDSKVNVIELYCGGLGRSHNDGDHHPEVATYFYGLSEVNIYGGTFENTIYGSGAGGVNGIGTATNHTDDQGLPYYNTDREIAVDGKTPHVWYAPYEYIKKEHNYDFVKVKASPTVYYGADPMNPTPSQTYTDNNLESGYVNLEKTRNVINIYGGVFGSESNPVSIYGGGNGAASAALVNPGSQQKALGVSNNFNTPNHQAGNMYGWVDNDDDPTNDILTSEINITGNTKIYGNIYGGGKGSMRYYRYFTRVANNANTAISYTNAFQNYTMYGGTTKYETGTATSYNISAQTDGALWKEVQDLRLNADNYLNLGQVYGNTKVSIGGNVEIYGNVYGGGEGVADMTLTEFLTTQDAEFGLTTVGTETLIFTTNVGMAKDPQTGANTGKRTAYIKEGDRFVTFPNMGKIFGNAALEVKDNVIIHGNLYGGGDAGAIVGSSTVDILGAAQIYGKVYGAGRGLTVDKAKDYTQVATIVGDTHVNLSGENAVIWQNMYGGGENAVVTGNTNFNMTNGNVAANIFGGGEGKVEGVNITRASILKSAPESTTTGHTNVSITGGKMIWDRTSLSTPKLLYRYLVTKPEVSHSNVAYESRESTKEAAKEELEANGYTVDAVASNGSHIVQELDAKGETVNITIYDYTVSYKEPAVTYIEAVVTPYDQAYLDNPENHTTVAIPETATYTEGEIIDWNDDHKDTFYDYENGRFLIEHNIFGGGYVAGNVEGTARIRMTKGLIEEKLLRRMEWQQSYNRHEYPHFYVFGGGYGIHTKVDSTDVYVALPVDPEVGGSSGTDQQLAKPSRGLMALDGEEPEQENLDFEIYSDSYGLPNSTVLGILGGGFNGIVNNTNVLIGDATFVHRVYGGGLGSYDGWVAAGRPASFGAQTDATGYSGLVAQNANVTMIGGHVYGDVFGGGAGVASKKEDGENYTDYPEIARVQGNTTLKTYSYADYLKLYNAQKTVYDAWVENGKQGDAPTLVVKPKEMVEPDPNANIPYIYGSVYGGGDVANVTANSSVELHGGNIYEYTVGAGYGRTTAEAQDYTSIGKVGGNSSVIIATSEDVENTTVDPATKQTVNMSDEPFVWNDIYGGGRNGLVAGDTKVYVNGGNIGDNIFGAGWGNVDNDGAETYANVGGSANVTIDKGFALWNKMANKEGDVKTWKRADYIKEATDVSAADTMFYDTKTKRFKQDHNVYGGGNVACVVDGNTEVMMNETHISDPDLFLNLASWNETPRWSLAAMCWKTTLEEQREPQFSVFGGGYGLRTKTNGNAAARVEVLAVRYADEGRTQLLYYADESKDPTNTTTTPTAYGPVEHWTTGWDYDYEHKLEWTAEENNGGTPKARLANFYPENYERPNYVDAERRLRTSAFAKQVGVAGNTVMQVIGGGYNGSVEGNTTASAQSRVIVGKMYGGGFGSYEGWTLAKELDGDGVANWANKVGTVGGEATLDIDRGSLVYGDAFGGGAGVESRKIGDDETYTDFPEVARVKRTHVKLGAVGASEKYDFVVPVVYGSLYGGGDVANVTEVAKTDLHRGQVMQYFFGGGNGRLATQCDDYTRLGSVGATDVHFQAIRTKDDGEGNQVPYSKQYGSVTQTYAHEPIVWQRTYAGGRNGIVRGGYTIADGDVVNPGDTKLTIDGGQFGHNIFGGGWGAVTDKEGNSIDLDGIVDPEVDPENVVVTSADVKGNTNIVVNGGTVNIDQIWNMDTRTWEPRVKDLATNIAYSPQYDFKKTEFTIKHNIYSGGDRGCVIGTVSDGNLVDNTGSTNVTMHRGMIDHQFYEERGTPFLESWEWKAVYEKHGTPYFCVFGGGYGEKAVVLGNANVNIDVTNDALQLAKDISPVETGTGHNHTYSGTENIVGCNGIHDRQTMNYTKFADAQSMMDVVGGGYNGPVNGTCNISVDGQPFMRNIFGGAYYAPVGSTNIVVHSGNIDNIYGGGMMGDVNNKVNVQIGSVTLNNSTASHLESVAAENARLVILGDVYGGNDVSGNAGLYYVGDGEDRHLDIMGSQADHGGVKVNLRGGHIKGNVYGGGNGNYLYMVDGNLDQWTGKVTAYEDYEINGEKRLVYGVPMRGEMNIQAENASPVQKIVNISSFRPVTAKTAIDMSGNAEPTVSNEGVHSDYLRVDGAVFGGGNSTTISDYVDHSVDAWKKASVDINIGSNIKLGKLFFGSDGDAMFDASADNMFINEFPMLNNLSLRDPIEWNLDVAPENEVSEKFLSTPVAKRPDVYKSLLDLYFMPVEMSVMPQITWAGRTNNVDDGDASNDVPKSVMDNVTIGTFCCGGNRGNMDTEDNFHVFFPEGLTITENIIGGCNNSNYTLGTGDEALLHEGGYLLGTHKVETGGEKRTPQIQLTMLNQFRPTMEKENGEVTTDASELYMYREGNNVYGGCYHSGTVRGDILIDMRSNMINGLDSVALDRGGDSRAVCNVFGAGYGSGTWVYGDTQVLLGKDIECTSGFGDDGKFKVTGASANYVYGGGQKGNVVGTTTVRVLNGRVAGCIVGASYAGNLYGSAQTIVGYPDTYYVCNTTGKYELTRIDQNHFNLLGDDGKPVVKRQIWHTKGDIVSEATYTELADADKKYFDAFTLDNTKAEQPADWSKVNIQIDQAIYGGGYALPDGSGSYTVRKYTSDRNLNNYAESVYGLPAETTLDNDGDGDAFGGNTFVMIGDRVAQDNDDDRDHITISSSQLVELHPSASDELFGKYYKSDDGIVYINYPTTIAQNSKFDENTKFYNFIGRGGLYGDGRLSLSEGYRVSDIRGYGYNGTKPSDAKLLNCLHRFDASRFTDCCISILGDLDYTSSESGGSGAVKYAIARIGELQMVSSIDDSGALSVDVTTDGNVTQMGKRSRNYIGFSNTVRDLGAVWSNVKFDTDSKHHDETGTVGTKTYKEYKQDIISANYNSQKAELRADVTGASAEFQKRNNGTSKNMLGIASGFALRVENSFASKMPLGRDATPEPVDANNFYYGPAFGVFEVKLVNTRPGEAGGYVYAQNIHQENISVDESTVHDFMESTGNFVFPMSETRKVVDDCYPYAYTKAERDNVNAIESKDGHYWYVTGMNYFYYGTITGYTFDSKDSPLDFNMNSKELRINLTGAKARQDVTLKEFRMLKNHSSEFADVCDIENKFYTNKNNEIAYGEDGWTTPNAESYYKLSLSATEDGVYKDSEESGDKAVPHIQELAEYSAPAVVNNSEAVGKVLDGHLQSDNPYLAIRLTDKVDNNGRVDDGHGGTTSYLKKYLDEACQAIIVLTTPAVDDNGARIYDAYEVSKDELSVMQANVNKPNPVVYYIIDGNGDYHSLTQSEVLALEKEPEAVFVAVPDRYTALGDGAFDSNATYYVIDEVNGTLAADGNKYLKVESPTEDDKEDYYTKQAGGSPKTYEYTINLTIKYIQGPSYEGKATVQNCALPGEIIRLSSSTITITSDAIDMPQNGSMWTVGPGKKSYANDGTYTWELDDTDPSKVFKYNPKDVAKDDNVIASRGVLAKSYYDEDSKDLYIPAYYFMNGYIARYSYSVKGISENDAPKMFHVTVFPEDTLLVHNYHRMNPTLGFERTPVETYIRKAAERYASDVTRLAADKEHDADDNKSTEPRQTNMAVTYVNRPRVYIEDVNDLKAFANYVNADGNDYGNDLEFFLMADITVPGDWTPITNFKGVFHGNGHILKGLDTKSLFAANAGDIYNLGLLQGKITNEETPSLYHCCYTKGNNTVYRMDGSAVTSYTDDDWKYGKVAYDLNQYYLAERYDLREGVDTHNHAGYVENIYANGDYQYARTYAKDAREEYLRTNANPHYVISDFDALVTSPEYITYHNTAHDQDKSRAFFNDDAVPADPENDVEAKPATLNEYRPLFEAAKQNYADEVSTGVKNDYIFFGQDLSTANNLPVTIASRLVGEMTNRVYRAYGYYKSVEDNAFHYNANVWALHPDLTAIDFSGAHESSHPWQESDATFFYPQVLDLPSKFNSFNVVDAITRNLLVYNKATEKAEFVGNAFNAGVYGNDKAEKEIKYHTVSLIDGERGIDYFRLVERATEDQPKNDFCAPIEFKVNERAWYTRQPAKYAERNNDAWEGICLPFTANKVEASLNGEITHFYGTPTEAQKSAPDTNDKTLHHEYWLRGLTGVADNQATFQRPGEGLFAPSEAANIDSYLFENDWFVTTYAGKDYNYDDASNQNKWYNEEHTYTDYKPLTTGIPYIVSFPGNRFYEFDLSSKFYNEMLGMDAEEQTVTFNYNGETTIPVTEEINTTVDSYSHMGTYLAIDNAAYGMNETGTAFDYDVNTVLPFRTYMSPVQAQAKGTRSIIIGEVGEEKIDHKGVEEVDPSDGSHTPKMLIYPRGRNVVVESPENTTLNMYTIGGQLMRVLDVREGTNTYSGFGSGIYIVGGKRLMLK